MLNYHCCTSWLNTWLDHSCLGYCPHSLEMRKQVTARVDSNHHGCEAGADRLRALPRSRPSPNPGPRTHPQVVTAEKALFSKFLLKSSSSSGKAQSVYTLYSPTQTPLRGPRPLRQLTACRAQREAEREAGARGGQVRRHSHRPRPAGRPAISPVAAPGVIPWGFSIARAASQLRSATTDRGRQPLGGPGQRKQRRRQLRPVHGGADCHRAASPPRPSGRRTLQALLS